MPTFVLIKTNLTMRYLVIILLLAQFQIVASESETISYKFRVYLKDKHTTEFEKTDPLTYLSQKAIDRRKEQCVEIDSTDYPVSYVYKNEIINQGVDVVAESKWFNTVVVHCDDSLQIKVIENLSFVDSVKFVWRGQQYTQEEHIRPRLIALDCETDTLTDSYFGISDKQFAFHNAQSMHNAGFQGKGIDIAVIDAGFTNIDVIPAFVHSFIRGYKNFIPDGNMFSSIDHGTKVLSTMALNLPHKVMGSAPQSSYLLLRSEDEHSEFPVEEDYWVAAIEYADSLGVKLVNTSLGYNHFDDSSLNYTHKELTGVESFISKATNAAFDKGMLIVGSAGNEGNKEWLKITVPGDSEKMLTIGAVTLDSTVTSFSSHGPTVDGRIKPDLVSIGSMTVTIGQTGLISYTNGTSFSSPFLTGLIGSLWSVNPQLNRNELIDIVRQSAHQFQRPDSILGYGIPDFKIAYQNVLRTLKKQENGIINELMQVSMIEKESMIIALNEPQYDAHSYSLRVLNKDGNTIISEKFDSSEYIFTISEAIREENDELFVVVQSPFEQLTVRLKI